VGKEENQRQVFLFVHEPLEIAVAIPTFPQPRLSAHGKVEIQNQDSHFPTLAYLSLKSKNERRINPACYPRPSGSSQDWKMLLE
jgi:hypothetical protein